MIVILILGCLIVAIGGVWTLIEAFKTGILWGLGCIFIPFLWIVWLITHWEEGAKPFWITLLGTVIVVVGTRLVH